MHYTLLRWLPPMCMKKSESSLYCFCCRQLRVRKLQQNYGSVTLLTLPKVSWGKTPGNEIPGLAHCRATIQIIRVTLRLCQTRAHTSFQVHLQQEAVWKKGRREEPKTGRKNYSWWYFGWKYLRCQDQTFFSEQLWWPNKHPSESDDQKYWQDWWC